MKKQKIQALRTDNSTRDTPCDLVVALMRNEENGGTLETFLSGFAFDSQKDIEKAIRDVCFAVAGDRFVNDKETQKNDVRARSLASRYNDILNKQEKFETYPLKIAQRLWNSGYSKQRLQERTAALFAKHTPDARTFEKTCKRIREVYALTAEDVDKLRFFVEMVKAGESFPNSLRRMLYLWGAAKMTGKTTTASIIVSLLNGSTDWQNDIQNYKTTLANELQIGGFKVPRIAECNACLMDEAFFFDMQKVYTDFKALITSSSGSARLPYGQEFTWTGCPNYVATSNDALATFIKDWNDRRYLAVEFKGTPEALTLDEVAELWQTFIFNSTPRADWKQWADELVAAGANEDGERTERAEEFALELRSPIFAKHLATRVQVGPKYSAANYVSLKFFVDFFANTIGTAEAARRRGEIESAVLQVFGPRYSSTRFWLLGELQDRADRIQEEQKEEPETAAIVTATGEIEKTPF